jgi:hypothetical protein
VLPRTYFFSGRRHPGLTSRLSRLSVEPCAGWNSVAETAHVVTVGISSPSLTEAVVINRITKPKGGPE